MRFSNLKEQQILAQQANLLANLKLEWITQTQSLCEEFRVVADVLRPREDAFIFLIGKQTPFSVMRSSGGRTIKYLKDTGDDYELSEMTIMASPWVLLPDVVKTLIKYKSKIVF